ncbi:MAG TPA: hypothetical protein VHZ24_02735 [Pirellulales bacterium]|jgi:GNAT superfamily N-acetyltransferase|nr:hypothetical protein [Pirellulales bacterium]
MPRRRFRCLSQAVRYFGYRALRRGLGLEVSHAMLFDLSRAGPIDNDSPGYEFRFLSPDDVWAFAADPANDLDAAMADRLVAGDDVCFAAIHGSRLANYNWYAFGGIEAEHAMRVPMTLPAGFAYLYKGFTHPDYRGRGLNYATVLRALHALRDQGMEQIVGIIEYANWPSLTSYRRFRPVPLGLLMTLGQGRPRWVRYPPRAKAIGVEFGREAENRRAAHAVSELAASAS